MEDGTAADGKDEEDEETRRLRAELEELDRVEAELKARLSSVSNGAEEKRARPRLRPAEPRDRKMFGMLMGTLKRARQESTSAEAEELKRRREEKEARADRKSGGPGTLRRAPLSDAERRKLEDRRRRHRVRSLDDEEKRLIRELEEADTRLESQTAPRIFFTPAWVNERTKRELERSQSRVASRVNPRLVELRRERRALEQEIERGQERLADDKASPHEPEQDTANGHSTIGAPGDESVAAVAERERSQCRDSANGPNSPVDDAVTKPHDGPESERGKERAARDEMNETATEQSPEAGCLRAKEVHASQRPRPESDQAELQMKNNNAQSSEEKQVEETKNVGESAKEGTIAAKSRSGPQANDPSEAGLDGNRAEDTQHQEKHERVCDAKLDDRITSETGGSAEQKGQGDTIEPADQNGPQAVFAEETNRSRELVDLSVLKVKELKQELAKLGVAESALHKTLKRDLVAMLQSKRDEARAHGSSAENVGH